MRPNTIIVNPKDNVAIALDNIPAGKEVRLSDGRIFPALADIPYSHKVLLVDVKEGQDVIKYGEVISQARTDLQQGEWVHTHNLLVLEE